MPIAKILVIDDDPEIRRVLREILQSAGYTCILAKDGLQGLEAVIREKPDLILLDLHLPKLPGEEVCKDIRDSRDPGIASIPVIMLTEKAGLADRVLGRVLGADRYLTKPFPAQDLLAQIEEVLSTRSFGSHRG